MKITSLLLCFSLIVISVPFAFAQTKSATTFKVNTLVSDGKKSKEVDSALLFQETSFKAENRKTATPIKEFNYADIKAADYSYSKKPLLSTGGAIATVIFLGLLSLPFLFMKKKQHWLSVRTDNDYVVMRLDKNNYRQIINEFETHQVTVKTVDEENEKKKDK
ncbi:MAG: hypothetical protein ABIP06_10385 [Pyrinomonadaceae bacterium]